MIKWILHWGTKRYGRKYNYDVTYLHELIDKSTSAALRYQALPLVSQFKADASCVDVWSGALLASTLDGDCGPCVQLVVDMAIEAGVDINDIEACLENRLHEAGVVGLGFRFSRSIIAGDSDTSSLRAQIESQFGNKGVIVASFAAATGRVYPVIKRGFGHGKLCSKVQVGNKHIVVSNIKK